MTQSLHRFFCISIICLKKQSISRTYDRDAQLDRISKKVQLRRRYTQRLLKFFRMELVALKVNNCFKGVQVSNSLLHYLSISSPQWGKTVWSFFEPNFLVGCFAVVAVTDHRALHNAKNLQFLTRFKVESNKNIWEDWASDICGYS